MDLLERDAAMRQLETALRDAERGEGRVALVGGEAGIGKTTLVERFTRGHSPRVRVLWGACDALFTPRPLGPVHDIAAQISGTLPSLLTRTADRTRIFSAMLAELQGRPVIAVIEDVHWADEATLDLLRFLGRRITRTAALLVLTYRDDELGPGHPLRTVLGDLASSPATLRIPLSPLSEHAVRVLVGDRSIDAAALHHQTGGNPFFVTEVLSSTDVGLPRTVRDAVLGRVARLSPSAQVVLEAAAVVGPRIEPWLLAAMAPADAQAADECLFSGVFVASGKGLAFRHELARQAVLDAIAPLRRALLHRLALDALRASPRGSLDLNRLAHLAEGADDRVAVLTYAPAAAREAAAASAHREAAALYALALRFAESLPPADRAALLEAHAWECRLTADLLGAIASRRQAVGLRREAGDPLKQGENLAQLAIAFIAAGRRNEARQASQAAIELLEALPPGRELALAYRTRAVLLRYNHDLVDAIALAERAISLAEKGGDARILAMAYDTLGVASLHLDYERGRQHLERARVIAHRAGLDSEVARAYANLGAQSVELFHLDQAERDLADGLAYAAERDLDTYRRFMVGWLAVAHLLRGRWPEAAAAAAEVLRSPPSNARWAALIALGRLGARRDGAVAPPPLDEALELALACRQLQMIGPARAARAEAAWLAGDCARTLAEAEAAYPLAIQKRHPWLAGELAFWRWRAGAGGPPPDWVAAPYALQITGDWRGAAEAWHRLGCPYEEARALADGDVAAQEQALAIFDRLGARTAAAALRRAMRAQGIVRLPRGPRPTTRTNRFGLTTRQLEMLSLLAEGLTNAEIAGRLSIAPKTAEHHVAAVLAKLDVSSRQAAVRLARGQQLISER
jgi:DNA-binding CsgD family transcriptional regulator/tetratricopeptide (TPR) repeat protein